jgi:hypothetical protein
MKPCWVTAAETTTDLDRVHAWNEMVQMLKDTAAMDDDQLAASVALHLEAICLEQRRGRHE